VVIEAAQLCMMMRGVEKQNSSTITSALCGVFRDDARTREELRSSCAWRTSRNRRRWRSNGSFGVLHRSGKPSLETADGLTPCSPDHRF
jgi:transposase